MRIHSLWRSFCALRSQRRLIPKSAWQPFRAPRCQRRLIPGSAGLSLEGRELLSGISADDAVTWWRLNQVRKTPTLLVDYGVPAEVASQFASVPPLAAGLLSDGSGGFTPGIFQTAQDWSNQLQANGKLEHGPYGTSLRTAGFDWSSAGEVVYYGSIPWYAGWEPPLRGWFNSSGHRKILMTARGLSGFGTSSDGAYRTGQVCSVQSWPQVLTGVVWHDRNANGVFDPGEGLAGRSLRVDNQSVTTGDQGLWSLPVSAGRHTIEYEGSSYTVDVTAGTNRQFDIVETAAGGLGFSLDFTWVPPQRDLQPPGVTNPTANRPPMTTDDLALTESGKAVVIPVLANDFDPDGGPITIVSFTAPEQGGIVSRDAFGNLVFTPIEGFSGVATFRYTVADPAGAVASATVRVTVQAVDTTPPAIRGLRPVDPRTLVLILTEPIRGFEELSLASLVSVRRRGRVTGWSTRSLAIRSVEQLADGTHRIQTSRPLPAGTLRLFVRGLQDLAGNQADVSFEARFNRRT